MKEDRNYIVCGASGNGCGDIYCGFVKNLTFREAVNQVYDEMVEHCGGEYKDWMPCSDQIIDCHERNVPIVVKASDSGNDYDYAWRIVKL